jgi:hypothetical protein
MVEEKTQVHYTKYLGETTDLDSANKLELQVKALPGPKDPRLMSSGVKTFKEEGV